MKTSDNWIRSSENSDALLRITQSSSEAIAVARFEDGMIIDVNDAYEQLTGYPREEIIGKLSLQFAFWLNADMWRRVLQALEEKKEAQEIHARTQKKDGTQVYLKISMRVHKIGSRFCIVCSALDISAHRRPEKSLEEEPLPSHEMDFDEDEVKRIIDDRALQNLMNSYYKATQVGMAIIDLKGNILVGTGWQDVCMKFHRTHPQALQYCIESDTFLSRNVEQGKYVIYKCKNNLWDMATPIIVEGRHIANIFLGQFFFEDEVPDYEFFTKQAERCQFDQKAYLEAIDRVPRWSRDKVHNAMEFYAKLANMIASLSSGNIRLEKSLAERKKAEDALRESEERFRSLVEQSPVAITIVRDMKVLYANIRFVEMFGYENDEEMKRLSLTDLVAPAFQGQFVARARNRESNLPAETVYEGMGVRKDGAQFHAMVTAERIGLADGPATIGFVQDISERKQAEQEIRRLNLELQNKITELIQTQEELVRKEKLAVLGRLAGVVGHEIRNPLTAMNNAVYFLKTAMSGADDVVKEYLDILKHEIDNSQRIISDLLNFARTKTPQTSPTAVNELVMQVLGKCVIPGSIDVQTDIPDLLPEVNVDPFQMNQVLRNLITNAVQAMPKGGVLRISAQEGQGARCKMQGHNEEKLEPDRDFVEISVADAGSGISPENMEKLFQPLFTTKTKGIGLGLTICKNLVEANGGMIEVKSKVGAGCTFTVRIPIIGDE